MVLSLFFINEKFTEQLRRSGSRAIKAMADLHRLADKDGYVSRCEFDDALKKACIFLPTEEVDVLFRAYGKGDPPVDAPKVCDCRKYPLRDHGCEHLSLKAQEQCRHAHQQQPPKQKQQHLCEKPVGDRKLVEKLCAGTYHHSKSGKIKKETSKETSNWDGRGPSGRIHLDKFLDAALGKMNDFRHKLVSAAFAKIDKDRKGYATIDEINCYYNALCQPAVMERRKDEDQMLTEYLDMSFRLLDKIFPWEFKLYHQLVSAEVREDKHFELLMMKDWKVCPDGFDVDAAENKVKLTVYRNRINLAEFFIDFDKLRSGYITGTQFQSGLVLSGVTVTEREMTALADKYRNPLDGQKRTCYRAFVDEVNTVFTLKELERTPLRYVPPVPPLLGNYTERFRIGERHLTQEKEHKLSFLIEKIRRMCKIKGVLAKPLFDDAAKNVNSTKRVGHVTMYQFRQALKTKMGISLSDDDFFLIAEKYDEQMDGMINYVAFVGAVDPPPTPFDPYRD
ncbi:hypothetical protein CBR_g34803 [Chara braunii]|uniref:EF-hand domain-containing protein n=1 Tax=Chara braunii TaxID=69332 RepID=A0A388LJH9_CHABU|nr:hypothetical protein CBR_g34803 [Chara braunii]|eukprot:GBG82427.1 hypothetical protein CBR_g34803 [Chara braunii]